MLKTQIANVFYLCSSFLLITISFAPNPVPASAFSLPANRYEKYPSGGPQIKLNKEEMRFAKKYIRNSSECLASIKEKSVIPFYIIDSVFNHYGLPVELKYLAVIESELKPSALSQVGAMGPWQLMPATARDLGLKITKEYDERSDYYKSTSAAAKYLRDLYAQFDDWLLVLAAYNGGPKPVYTAIRESGSKNFWVLQHYLPAESREHVKRFIAVHYYFEGRGSETTLTRAENAVYEKTLNEFAKSRPDSETSQTKNARSGDANRTHKWNNLTVRHKPKQKFKSDSNLHKNQNIASQFEASQQNLKGS